MSKVMNGTQFESTVVNIEKKNNNNSVYSTFFKKISRPQTYKQTKETWIERMFASNNPNTKWNFKIGYYKETGIACTQMKVNKQIQNGFETKNNNKMKHTRDRSKKVIHYLFMWEGWRNRNINDRLLNLFWILILS